MTVFVLVIVAVLFVRALLAKNVIAVAALWALIFAVLSAASHHVLGL